MSTDLPGNIRELVELHADVDDKPCVLWGDEQITFRQLNDRANSVANGLKALGIGKGDVVSVYLPNCPDYYYVWFGIIKIGAVFGPINALFKGDEVRHVLSDSGAVAIVISDAMLGTIDAVRGQCPALRHVICLEGERPGAMAYAGLLENSSQLAPVDIQPSDLAAIVYTSGTTGKPKGAMLSHWNYVWDTAATADSVPTQIGGGCVGLILPLFHVNAQVTSLNQFLSGGCVAMWERFSPGDFWELVDKYCTHTFSSVPTMLSILLLSPRREGLDLSSLQYVISGAAPLPLELATRFEQAFNLRIIEGYGLTEGTCVSSLNPYWGVRKIGSIGLPLRGQQMRIVDDNMNTLPPGEYGEIAIKGPNVMQGYFNNPQATAETIVDGWLRTGDMAYMDEDGYFFIVDRKKDMIIRAGENIYPREIEEVLFAHPKVADVTVIGRPDAVWGEEVLAVIVPQPGETLTIDEVKDFCRARLADYKLPRGILLRDALPKTLTGKVQKKALRDELFRSDASGR